MAAPTYKLSTRKLVTREYLMPHAPPLPAGPLSLRTHSRQLAEHMAMRSGDDQTLLMIAAASRDKMTFKACVDKLRFLITPHDVSEIAFDACFAR